MKTAQLFFIGVLAAVSTPLYGQWVACSVGGDSSASLEKKADNNFVLTAVGNPLAGKADSMAFASGQAKLIGNCEIVAHVASVTSDLKQNRQDWVAGIMMRETLSTESKFLALGCTNSHGLLSFMRAKPDADMTIQEICDCAVPYWIKITRHGDHFVISKSSDGMLWIQVDDVALKMKNAVWVGVFSTSGGPAQIVTGFDHVNARALPAEKASE